MNTHYYFREKFRIGAFEHALNMLRKKKEHTANQFHNDIRTERGFKNLYENQAPRLFTICYKRIGVREEAEEMVHDIFKSVWERRMAIVDQDNSIEHYMARAAKLKVIDHYRKQERQKRIMHLVKQDYEDAENRTEDDVDLIELKGQIKESIEQLPPKCQKVYRLSRNKGYNNKHIAKVLKISEKTVEAHISKALSHLRRNLNRIGTVFLILLNLS